LTGRRKIEGDERSLSIEFQEEASEIHRTLEAAVLVIVLSIVLKQRREGIVMFAEKIRKEKSVYEETLFLRYSMNMSLV